MFKYSSFQFEFRVASVRVTVYYKMWSSFAHLYAYLLCTSMTKHYANGSLPVFNSKHSLMSLQTQGEKIATQQLLQA
jgi:hypothetical protein